MELIRRSDDSRLADIGITDADYWHPDREDGEESTDKREIPVNPFTLVKRAILNQAHQKHTQPQSAQYE